MIQKGTYTGMTLNTIALDCAIKGPKTLLPSKNSAFCAKRKRMREEVSAVELSSFKKFKLTEDPTTNWGVAAVIKSASSSGSTTHKEQTELPKSENLQAEEAKIGKEVILKTRTLQFAPYGDLEIKTRQEFYSQTLRTVGNQCVRGRKRTSVTSKASSIVQLIEEIIIPEWQSYLIEKRDKENVSKHFCLRSDAVWKKLFRDCREFFRILFKHRFHRMDYQTCEAKLSCIKILTEELGFPLFADDNLIFFFQFFHQIHLSEKNKAKYKDILTENPIGVEALNRYTNQSRTLFLKDPMCSRLLYFVYQNYKELYSTFLSMNIKLKVEECITYFLDQYNSCLSEAEIICTDNLPI
ncbi:unnamed protein product [Moneuplotes crassus]|uniref:Uncharacterized protein n=1 Tax=Euplotes crassus TaxID=5936 RepID=A0AAD1XK17_EUPCR|nr:unnamed protein product [Moneuplotes crassus]